MNSREKGEGVMGVKEDSEKEHGGDEEETERDS